MHRVLQTGSAWLSTLILATAASAQFDGYVDLINQQYIAGWAGQTSGDPVWVHIFIDGVYATSIPSNSVRRPDAAPFAGGNEWCGFSQAMPRMSPGPHSIAAYVNSSIFASTEFSLRGQTQVVVPVANFVGPAPFGVVESLSPQRITGWAADADSPEPVIVDVYAQLDGAGDGILLASGPADGFRPDVGYGGSHNRGFDMPLPVLRGGLHNIYAVARNLGAGSDRILEDFYFNGQWVVPDRIASPDLPSWNPDPSLQEAAGCWTVLQSPGLFNCQTCACPPVNPRWALSITSDTIMGWPTPRPLAPFSGAPTRVRYDYTAANGFRLKVDTAYDAPGEMWPWQFNFQALQTNLPPVMLDAVNQALLEVHLRINHEGEFFSYDPNLTGPCSELGNTPWIHAIVGSVFGRFGGPEVYFLEAVPFFRENQAGLGCTTPAHPCWTGQTVCFPTTTLGIGGPPGSRNARLPLTDPRLAPAVSLPSTMALGEERTLVIDLKQAVQGVFAHDPPFAPIDMATCMYGGGYIGTEQFGRNRVALDIRRMSVQLVYRAPTLDAAQPSHLPAGSADSPLDVEARQVSFDSSIEWNGQSLPTQLVQPGHLRAMVPASLLTTPGMASVRVRNPAPGGGLSNPVRVAITDPCYANCDGSVQAPRLNVLDFSCFLNRFAAGDPYANCDNSTTPPAFNVLDFTCFLNQFAAGCP